jgi:prefoldin subunit 5
LVEELQIYEEEIQMCLDDLQDLNEHIVELTAEYEQLLNKLCKLQGITLPEEL